MTSYLDWATRKDVQRRADGRLEWVCSHGVGHTVWIPSHIYKTVETLKAGDQEKIDAWFSHGCDGCCKEVKS